MTPKRENPLSVEEAGLEKPESLRAQQECSVSSITLTSLSRQPYSPDEEKADFEKTIQQLRAELAESRQKADRFDKILDAQRQKQQCETLYGDGHVIEAAQSLLKFAETTSEVVKDDPLIGAWLPREFCHNKVEKSVRFQLSGFTDKCIMGLEKIGDDASKAGNRQETLVAYDTALCLGPSTPNTILDKWGRTMLCHSPTGKVLDVAVKVRFS